MAHSLEVAQEVIARQNPDIIICNLFLDGKPKGLDLLHQFPDYSKKFIIITSSLDSSFYETTNSLGVGGHLVKPFHALTLRSTIDRILATVEKTSYLFVRGLKNAQIRINFNDILYLYSERNYTFIKTSDNLHTIKRSLIKMQQELDTRFIRVHNSYIINEDHIKSIATQMVLIEKEIIPLGRAYRKNLIDKHNLKRYSANQPGRRVIDK
ncbi:LytR/AlgR family response regulator transcription factor [Spirosoma pollinicola]|uniref:LytR/AlgR family response regulator transcription factor n=1 Tax=Spirosoma pollinicola TaxID=2057025 RepID=UPI0014735145|nr:LytTR family DNA-binding domain-containing protein [Spirosoma pollinicola]